MPKCGQCTVDKLRQEGRWSLLATSPVPASVRGPMKRHKAEQGTQDTLPGFQKVCTRAYISHTHMHEKGIQVYTFNKTQREWIMKITGQYMTQTSLQVQKDPFV